MADTISLPGKNTKEELKELQEFEERSQEPQNPGASTRGPGGEPL
jgi:hypothetical protein